MSAPAPLVLHRERVRSDWIDYNGHMNVAYYMLVFDHATDAFLDHIGHDAGHRAHSNHTTYVLEGHITYDREVREDAPLRITTQLLDYDEKRVHYFHCMYHEEEGYLAATNELMLMNIDRARVRGAPMAAPILARLEALMAQQRGLERPAQAGRVIGIRRRSAR